MISGTVSDSVRKTFSPSRMRLGFSLAEVLAALTIGAMVIVAVLGIYHRAEHSASAALHRLDHARLPGEVLQRIAEDLDRIICSSSDAKVTIENKLESTASGKLIPAARLAITRTIRDVRDREHTFEEVTWQSSYNYESLIDGLVLYRSHSGINLEDKVLQQNKYDWERELFVPICSGVTFFKISASGAGAAPVERWDGPPPPGIVVEISFAEPYKGVDGTYEVLDEEKIARTIAVDRTRKIRFNIVGGTSTRDEGKDEGKEEAEDTSVSDGKSVPPGSSEKVGKRE